MKSLMDNPAACGDGHQCRAKVTKRVAGQANQHADYYDDAERRARKESAR